MRPAFPASDYYEGSATRPALAEGWPTPLPESRTCFPSSTRLHLHAVLGPACTPGTARCRARHRRMPIKGSTASLPEQGCLCKETEIPMTPPSPYRERVVHGATLQSAVPFVTITALWLAARGVVGWPPPHCREGFRHDSASGPRACFPSHRPTPGRVPHLERSTYALLGAPSFAMWPAFPTSDYYEGSAPRPALAAGWPTPLPGSRTRFPSSRRLRLPVAVGPAYTPSTARCRARHRGHAGSCGSAALLSLTDCPCPSQTGIPMTPPSPYRERVVQPSTLQSTVSCVTMTTLWLAARGVVG